MRVPRVCASAMTLTWIVGMSLNAGAETRHVRAGDNLQTALNNAQPGDVLLLQAGATFTGNFVLPAKSGTGFITIRSDTPDDQLPPAGTRMTPDYVGRLARIRSANTDAALKTAPGAHHWRVMLLEFPAIPLGYGDIIRLGDGSSAQSTLSQVPHDIDVDRVYIHGDPRYGQKRGIALNGRAITIRNSHVSDIKAVGIDSQAIGGWNGPGPFTIENNYLEAAGEVIMLGGADPAIPNLVSADVVVRRNVLSRPWSWRSPMVSTPSSVTASSVGGGSLPAGTYSYRVVARRPVGGGSIGRSTASAAATASTGQNGAVRISWAAVADATEYRVYGRSSGGSNRYWTVTGTSFTDTGAGGTSGAVPTSGGTVWTVKNLFELKNARRVLIEYNVFENHWAQAQPGYAILFTPRNQGGQCTWCVVEHVTFQYNVVRNAAAGINLLGRDSPNVSAQTNNILIQQNLFFGLTTDLGGTGWFLLIGGAPRNVTVTHNTVDSNGSMGVYVYGGSASKPAAVEGFSFTNNAIRHGAYGIMGAGFSWGNSTLAAYFPNSIVRGNWMPGGTASRYPAANYFSGTFESAFSECASGDYRLTANSVLESRATDGSDIGANIGYLMAGLDADTGSVPTPAAPAPPTGVRVVR